MDNSRTLVIAVIGGREADSKLLTQAQEVGRLIAEAGFTLACGGMGGVMEAACKGAIEAGGQTIGILPGDNTSSANPYVSIPIATGFGIGRNIILVRTADALIAIGGAYGTLSEIAHALQLNKPVIAIGSWDIDGVETAQDAGDAVDIVQRRLLKG